MACTDCTVHNKHYTEQTGEFHGLCTSKFTFRFAVHSFPYHKRDKMRKESVKLVKQQKTIQNYLLWSGL